MTSFFSHMLWNKEDLQAFRLFCFLIAAMSSGLFLFTAHSLHPIVLAMDDQKESTKESTKNFTIKDFGLQVSFPFSLVFCCCC